jgi:hypothetical protein
MSQTTVGECRLVYVVHGSGLFHVESGLYRPFGAALLAKEYKIVIPQQDTPIEANKITADMIAKAYALVAEVTVPSLGVGKLIGWAERARVPVIAMCRAGCKVSQSIRNAVNEQFAYIAPEDMLSELTMALWRLQPR